MLARRAPTASFRLASARSKSQSLPDGVANGGLSIVAEIFQSDDGSSFTL